MLDAKGFDSWAYEYDEDVRKTDERGDYPFAGYAKVLNRIEETVLANGACDVFDAGFGTAVLTKRLYDGGCRIWGQDYSKTMIQIAQEKMPGAKLYGGDLSVSLASPILAQKYDFAIATYALHHFTLEQKCVLIRRLLLCLKPGGTVLLGDIAFADAADEAACRARFADKWDDDEIYMHYDEMKQFFPSMTYEKISHCCGLFTLKNI
ncbi:MAG: class I SAM-dependent methyltransferase [Firmicutes bacterium]|nr:class I SAM-dependent methyltransferase [Bacillota bacterium]